MPSFSEGFRQRMVKRLVGPGRISANQLAKEVGVSQCTLSRWLREARTVEPMSKDANGPQKGPRRSAEDKLRLVIEASGLSGDELGAFLRREGIRQVTLDQWKETVIASATAGLRDATSKRPKTTPDQERIRALEKELQRKEKALAETAALLALKKKLEAICGDEDDDTTPRSGTCSVCSVIPNALQRASPEG